MASLYTQTITAMTTIFTPPVQCSRSWTYEDQYFNSIEGGLLLQNQDPARLDVGCFPIDFGMYGRAPSSIQVYSPGACPQGYSTPGQFQNDGTTTAICCPFSFQYTSTFSTIDFYKTTALFMGCISQFSGFTYVSARGNTTEVDVSGDITMWAQPITVEFQPRDLYLFGSLTSSGNSGHTADGSIRTTSIPSPTSNTSSSSSNNGAGANQEASSVSTRAWAGIAIGSVLGGLVLTGVAVWVFWKKRRDTANRSPAGGKDVGYALESKESDCQSISGERRELDASNGAVYRPELDGVVTGQNLGGCAGPRSGQQTGHFSELE